eukprot:2751205-Rhodomonas_salina.2
MQCAVSGTDAPPAARLHEHVHVPTHSHASRRRSNVSMQVGRCDVNRGEVCDVRAPWLWVRWRSHDDRVDALFAALSGVHSLPSLGGPSQQRRLRLRIELRV